MGPYNGLKRMKFDHSDVHVSEVSYMKFHQITSKESNYISRRPSGP
jgi:hypothetical protein